MRTTIFDVMILASLLPARAGLFSDVKAIKAMSIKLDVTVEEAQVLHIGANKSREADGDKVLDWEEEIEVVRAGKFPPVTPEIRKELARILGKAPPIDAPSAPDEPPETIRKVVSESSEETALAIKTAEANRVIAEAKQKKQEKLTSVEAKAAAFLRQRVQGGSSEAAYDLALRFIVGKGVDRDIEEARRLMVTASQKGHVEASRWLITNVAVHVESPEETTPTTNTTPSQGH